MTKSLTYDLTNKVTDPTIFLEIIEKLN